MCVTVYLYPRIKEQHMHSIVREVVVCFVFLFLVLFIAYTNRDPWSYKLYEANGHVFNYGYTERALTSERKEFRLVSCCCILTIFQS